MTIDEMIQVQRGLLENLNAEAAAMTKDVLKRLGVEDAIGVYQDGWVAAGGFEFQFTETARLWYRVLGSDTKDCIALGGLPDGDYDDDVRKLFALALLAAERAESERNARPLTRTAEYGSSESPSHVVSLIRSKIYEQSEDGYRLKTIETIGGIKLLVFERVDN